MLSFKQFLLETDETASFRVGSRLFAMDSEGTRFSDHFHHVGGFPDMFDKDGTPKGGVLAWGRIGWNDKGHGVVSLVTDAGAKPNSGFNKKALEKDIYHRIRAIDSIVKEYPDKTLLFHGGGGVMHVPTEHKKHLMSILGES